MPVAPQVSYPGVYIQEVPSDVRTITPVETATTAFIGRALRGPVNEPVICNSYADFEGVFGGLWLESSLGYAVNHFFLNGGSKAVIVRLYHPAEDSSVAENAKPDTKKANPDASKDNPDAGKARITYDNLSLEAASWPIMNEERTIRICRGASYPAVTLSGLVMGVLIGWTAEAVRPEPHGAVADLG